MSALLGIGQLCVGRKHEHHPPLGEVIAVYRSYFPVEQRFPSGGKTAAASSGANMRGSESGHRVPAAIHASRGAGPPGRSLMQHYMKNFWFIVLLVGLSACSEKAPQPKIPAAKPAAARRRYSVKFAAVKIPDNILQNLGLPAYEESSTPDSRRKLAAYVSARPAEFSVRSPTGNIVPLVRNNEQISMEILPDANQEAKDFETLGMMTKEFIPSVAIREENDKGEVYYDCHCSCGVHLKEPIGNATDQGRGGGCGGGMIVIGQPEIWPLCRGNGVSLWMLVTLNRP